MWIICKTVTAHNGGMLEQIEKPCKHHKACSVQIWTLHKSLRDLWQQGQHIAAEKVMYLL